MEIPSLNPLKKGYRIVFEKQQSSLGKKNLPKHEQQCLENLYAEIQENPKKHIDTLIALNQRCPHVPEIANLLAFAYLKMGKKKESEEWIEKAYRDHPDYLIAKINYADQCLRLKKAFKIPEIFEHCFELHALCPHCDQFHFAEFRGFQIVMGHYHLERGDHEKAEECYELAFQVDPLHPSVAVLERKLSKKPFLKNCLNLLQKLARIFKNP